MNGPNGTRLRSRHQLGVIDSVHDLLLDFRHQLTVHVETFTFEGYQGVLLAERPQANALSQNIQVGQVAHPQALDLPLAGPGGLLVGL